MLYMNIVILIAVLCHSIIENGDENNLCVC